jgi:acyl-CoA hydrolase
MMITVGSERIDFKMAIPAGTIIELIGKVSYTGNTSLKVRLTSLWNRFTQAKSTKQLVESSHLLLS